jgi:hypothetical protein
MQSFMVGNGYEWLKENKHSCKRLFETSKAFVFHVQIGQNYSQIRKEN